MDDINGGEVELMKDSPQKTPQNERKKQQGRDMERLKFEVTQELGLQDRSRHAENKKIKK